MSHNHNHSQATQNLKLAFFINVFFGIFEFFAGLYVNSYAIMANAIHDLGDSFSLGTAWLLEIKSKKKANHVFSYGYARMSLLGALINSVVIIAGSIFVVYGAIMRLIHPEASDANGMIVFAIIGVLLNAYAAFKLSGGKSFNEKVVSWHLLEDVLGWLAVLIAALVLKFYETSYLDPALSLVITAYILWGVIRRLKETMFVFLQGAPKDVDLKEIMEHLQQIPNVKSIHHTHIWSMDGQQHVFSTHIKLDKIDSLKQLKATKLAAKKYLSTFSFDHLTLEMELEEENCELKDEN